MKEKIASYLRAGYPALYLVSSEEGRVEDELLQVCGGLTRLDGSPNPRELVLWSCLGGFTSVRLTNGQKERTALNAKEGRDPISALQWAVGQERKVIVLRDFHHYLRDPSVQRAFKDACAEGKRKFTTIVVLSAVQQIPAELEKLMTVVDFALPGRETLERILGTLTRERENLSKEKIALLVEAASGLTEAEAENAFALSLIQPGALNPQFVMAEKANAVKRSGILEYYQPIVTAADIGGLDELKGWLRRRARAFSDEARKFGLPVPKGCLLIGVPGCGKSLTAKAASAMWGKPLLRLDVGRVFGSLVGESEGKMRLALQTAEAIAPCILWLDEMEKAFAGTETSLDSGTSARVFGSFLTWMQEKTAPVFVFATANNVAALPAELMRKGRFDEIFFVDLPGEEERLDIWDIHLRSRKRDPEKFDLIALTGASRDWTGAEIESAVVEAMYHAFDKGRELAQADLARATGNIVPLAQTMAERIEGLREWAKGRTRLASLPQPETVSEGRAL